MKLSAAAKLGLAVALLISLVQVSSALDWSLDLKLTSDVGWDNAPSVVQADDGKVWVAWHTDRNIAMGGGMDIYYRFLDGSSWSADTRLTTDAQNDMNPSLTQATDGRIWIVWETDRKLLDEDIYYRVFDGVSWSNDTSLCTELYPDKNPSVTATQDGKIWVVWSSIRTGDPEIFYKTFNGSAWSVEYQLTHDQNMDDEDPFVMQAMDGEIWVVWSKKSRAKNDDIYYKTFDGTWSADIQLTTDTGIDASPAIAQSMNGRIWVTWNSDRKATNMNVFYKIFDGVSWTAEDPLTSAMEDDKTPCITQTVNGSIWVVWASKRVQAQYDLYYRLGLELHDVAVLSVAPYAPHSATIAFRGEIVHVSVGVQNNGEAKENVEVQCFANSSIIQSRTTSLASGQYYSMVFQWNTTGAKLGSYEISAHILPVAGELSLENNSFADGLVEVRIIGDIVGVRDGVIEPMPDGRVDIDDFSIPIGHYGCCVPWSHPTWDSAADINEDGMIELDDIMTVGLHYGDT